MRQKNLRGDGQSYEAVILAALNRAPLHVMGPIIVAFILLLCFWSFVVQWWFVFPGLWSVNAWIALSVSGVHQFLNAMLVTSLIRACSRDPGFLVKDTLVDATTEAASKICVKCNCVKIDRSHHCSTCRRCVRRMDHHCAFVNNCVGANNLKFFILLLVYTTIGGFYNAFSGYLWFQLLPNSDHNIQVLVGSNAAVVGIIGLLMAPFAGLHLYLSGRNRTTLEALSGANNIYDKGLYRNLQQVFGRNPVWWLSPLHFDHAGHQAGAPSAEADFECLV